MAAVGSVMDNNPDSDVIAGVIEGMKQSFIDSGVDLEVLAKLEQLWVSKLSSSNSSGVAIADVGISPPGPAKRTPGRRGRNKFNISYILILGQESLEQNRKPMKVM